MIFFLISVLAGILTVLAPCILPLLPIVIGSTEGVSRGISRKAFTVIVSLSVSVIVFSILLKASTLFIDIPPSFWSYFSGSIIILVGIAIIFPTIYSRIPLIRKIHELSNKKLGEGFRKQNRSGDILIGLSLGPVFTTCSPTYLFIIATILPSSFAIGTFYLFGFTLGLAFSLLLIAYFGERLVGKLSANIKTAEIIKKIFALLIIVVGIAIFTGYDKKLETYILDSGYGATINFEENLINRFMR